MINIDIKDNALSLIKKIFKPLSAIKGIFIIFLFWFSSLMLFNNLNIIIPAYLNGSIIDAFVENAENGNLYSIAIAFCSASFTALFIEVITENSSDDDSNKTSTFNKFKLIWLAFITLFMFVLGILFATTLTRELNLFGCITEFILYVVSILISIYIFGINYMKYNSEEFKEYKDDNFLTLRKKVTTRKTDDAGIKL